MASLMLLWALGVDDETLDPVVEMVLVQNVDEEMTTVVNDLASGFSWLCLPLREEEVGLDGRGASGGHD